MQFFVFVDMEYYPYVGDPVEADTPEKALSLAIAQEKPGTGETVYVAPADAIHAGTMHGPLPRAEGFAALLESQMRFNAWKSDVLSQQFYVER